MKILGLPGSEPADQRGRQPRAVQILMEASLPVDICVKNACLAEILWGIGLSYHRRLRSKRADFL